MMEICNSNLSFFTESNTYIVFMSTNMGGQFAILGIYIAKLTSQKMFAYIGVFGVLSTLAFSLFCCILESFVVVYQTNVSFSFQPVPYFWFKAVDRN